MRKYRHDTVDLVNKCDLDLGYIYISNILGYVFNCNIGKTSNDIENKPINNKISIYRLKNSNESQLLCEV